MQEQAKECEQWKCVGIIVGGQYLREHIGFLGPAHMDTHGHMEGEES